MNQRLSHLEVSWRSLVLKKEKGTWLTIAAKIETSYQSSFPHSFFKFLDVMLKNEYFFVCHRAKTGPKEMPDFHFVEHKIVRNDLGGRDQKWQLVGSASASASSLWERRLFKTLLQYPDDNVVRKRPEEIKHIWNYLLLSIFLTFGSSINAPKNLNPLLAILLLSPFQWLLRLFHYSDWPLSPLSHTHTLLLKTQFNLQTQRRGESSRVFSSTDTILFEKVNSLFLRLS